jgi:hypothetical protein
LDYCHGFKGLRRQQASEETREQRIVSLSSKNVRSDLAPSSLIRKKDAEEGKKDAGGRKERRGRKERKMTQHEGSFGSQHMVVMGAGVLTTASL